MLRFRIEQDVDREENNYQASWVAIEDEAGAWCRAEDVQELVSLTNELLCHAIHRQNCQFVRSPVSSAYRVPCDCGLGSIQTRLESTNANFFDE